MEFNRLKSEIELLEKLDKNDELTDKGQVLLTEIKEAYRLAIMVQSESVRTLLRFGFKNPEKSGMDDCEDKTYIDLYNTVRKRIDHELE